MSSDSDYYSEPQSGSDDVVRTLRVLTTDGKSPISRNANPRSLGRLRRPSLAVQLLVQQSRPEQWDNVVLPSSAFTSGPTSGSSKPNGTKYPSDEGWPEAQNSWIPWFPVRPMGDDDSTPGTGEAPIDGAVAERVVEERPVDADALTNALLEANAELVGRHAELERSAEYVTVDGVRAYRVDDGTRDELLDGFEFDGDVAAAVRASHTEQARLLFADAVDGDDRFDADEAGVVIGVDTAEEF